VTKRTTVEPYQPNCNISVTTNIKNLVSQQVKT